MQEYAQMSEGESTAGARGGRMILRKAEEGCFQTRQDGGLVGSRLGGELGLPEAEAARMRRFLLNTT